MRARNIKPAFFKNDEMTDLSFCARLLFIGLWCYADRNGFFEYRPKKINAEIFPYENIDIDTELHTLVVSGFIHSMKSEEDKIIFKITNFEKHQKPHKNETASIYKDNMKPYDFSQNIAQPKHEQLEKRPLSHGLIEERGMMIEERGKRKEESYKKNCDLFKTFWDAYPRKTGKPKAEKVFCQIIHKTNEPEKLLKSILHSIELHKQCKQWSDWQYIPHPTTWLNREGWNDEVVTENTNQGNTRQTIQDHNIAVAKRMIKQAREEAENERSRRENNQGNNLQIPGDVGDYFQR